jgi:hypothetical protein
MKERKPLPSAIYLFLSDINLYIYIGVFQVHSDFIYENCVCFFPILESTDNTDTWVHHASFDKITSGPILISYQHAQSLLSITGLLMLNLKFLLV